MTSHAYILTENIGLGAADWSAVVALTDDLGQHDSPQPAFNNHKRTRLDGDATIHESVWDNAVSINCNEARARVGNALGIPPGQLDIIEEEILFDTVASAVCRIFQSEVELMQMTILGKYTATWEQSRQEVLAYLQANLSEWESL